MVSSVMIEDHTLVREGLKALLREHPEFKVVGEASEGKHGLKLVEKHKPDLVLLDLILPGLHGLEVLRKIRRYSKVLAISMRSDEAFVAEAFLNGVAGYVIKEDSFAELMDALHAVLKGQRFMSRKLDQRRINRVIDKLGIGGAAPSERLTTREHEVLQMAAEGLTSSHIGNLLSISPRTVEMHRANLMRKLGLRSQADLVRFAIRNRIVAA
jgi:DNA-binding NarL/FixJ family response regulator